MKAILLIAEATDTVDEPSVVRAKKVKATWDKNDQAKATSAVYKSFVTNALSKPDAEEYAEIASILMANAACKLGLSGTLNMYVKILYVERIIQSKLREIIDELKASEKIYFKELIDADFAHLEEWSSKFWSMISKIENCETKQALAAAAVRIVISLDKLRHEVCSIISIQEINHAKQDMLRLLDADIALQGQAPVEQTPAVQAPVVQPAPAVQPALVEQAPAVQPAPVEGKPVTSSISNDLSTLAAIS